MAKPSLRQACQTVDIQNKDSPALHLDKTFIGKTTQHARHRLAGRVDVTRQLVLSDPELH